VTTQLEQARDHARRMAETADDEGDRALWCQLADEIDEYLGGDDEGQGALI
jgi:hypothetical protein